MVASTGLGCQGWWLALVWAVRIGGRHWSGLSGLVADTGLGCQDRLLAPAWTVRVSGWQWSGLSGLVADTGLAGQFCQGLEFCQAW